jgi:uncharacterized protein
MPTDYLRYDILTQEALRNLVRTVLTDASKNGLPGEHHFFITFDTRADGVRISPRLSAQYPQDMRIVLQHQFWDLTVHEDTFEVGLSFNGIPERLVVPFAAIKSFDDPSVQFSLHFEVLAPPDTEAAEPPKAPSGEAPRLPARPADDASAAPATPGSPARPASQDEPDKASGGAEVVRLDRFRKK